MVVKKGVGVIAMIAVLLFLILFIFLGYVVHLHGPAAQTVPQII